MIDEIQKFRWAPGSTLIHQKKKEDNNMFLLHENAFLSR
jgi:hypothetical protein